MKLLRISEDLVIAPELISHYTVTQGLGFNIYNVLAHPFIGEPFPIAVTDGVWKEEIEDDGTWGWPVAERRARAELARIQALVEEL